MGKVKIMQIREGNEARQEQIIFLYPSFRDRVSRRSIVLPLLHIRVFASHASKRKRLFAVYLLEIFANVIQHYGGDISTVLRYISMILEKQEVVDVIQRDFKVLSFVSNCY